MLIMSIMLINILLTIIFIVFCAIFYHLGGQIKSCLRDWICPFFSLGITFIWHHPTTIFQYLAYASSYVLTGLALSIYWDKLTILWRGTDDEYFENWLLHGFFCGFASVLLIFAGMSFKAILFSSIASAVLMMLISVLSGSVKVEENGRGASLALSRILLLFIK